MLAHPTEMQKLLILPHWIILIAGCLLAATEPVAVNSLRKVYELQKFIFYHLFLIDWRNRR